jgi:hypothetical protein
MSAWNAFACSWSISSMIARSAHPAGEYITLRVRSRRYTRSARTLPRSGAGRAIGIVLSSAATTRSCLEVHRRYSAALPVWAQAATPSIVSRFQPTALNWSSAASKMARLSRSPRRRSGGGEPVGSAGEGMVIISVTHS